MLIRSFRLLILLLCIHSFGWSKVLIFDLGDVLFKQSRFGIARSVGLLKFGMYSLIDGKSPKIEKLLFSVLDSCEPQRVTDEEKICAPNGRQLPQIMCDWLNGFISPDELLKKANEHIDKYHGFISWREENLVRSTANVLFDPYLLVKNTHPIREGVKLLEECAAYRDEQGNPHTLVVLSNWDPYSFEHLYKRYQSLFNNFDHIVISGHIGLSKPQHACFQYVIDTFNFSPDACYFIDDLEQNVKAAQRSGMQGLQLKNRDYRAMRKQLIELNIL